MKWNGKERIETMKKKNASETTNFMNMSNSIIESLEILDGFVASRARARFKSRTIQKATHNDSI